MSAKLQTSPEWNSTLTCTEIKKPDDDPAATDAEQPAEPLVFIGAWQAGDFRYPLVNIQKAIECYWKWPFIVDLIFPFNIVIFHSYVNVYQRVCG